MEAKVISIVPDDARETRTLRQGEVVHHRVVLEIAGEALDFDVTLRANVLPALDASVLHGDSALEELLRFRPAALGEVLRAVARVRRGESVDFPLPLEGYGDAAPEPEHSARH